MTRSSPRLRRALLGWIAAWLLTQTLGQLHAVLHVRAAPASAAAAAAATGSSAALEALGRAFHPQGDPAHSDGGLCRLYGQLAQGDLAAGAAPVVVADGSHAVPAATSVASADAAPRRGAEARGPPAVG